MPTIVSNKIGTGQTYSTIALWEADAPSNLVTSDQIWRGLCINETFTGVTTIVTISGSTSDSTRYKELTTDTGASFIDNANVRTNPLKYDSSKGASIQNTYTGIVGGEHAIIVAENYARVSNLQIAFLGTNAATRALDANGVGIIIDRCIIEALGTSAAANLFNTVSLRNCLVIYRGTNTSTNIVGISSGAHAYNCTFISSVVTLTNGIGSAYGAGTLKNLALFGSTNVGTTAGTKSTCYTGASAISGWTNVSYDTSTGSGFENITDSTRDFRLKSTSALINVGTTDSTNAATDITSTSRPQGASYDVGCWEYMTTSIFPLPVGFSMMTHLTM